MDGTTVEIHTEDRHPECLLMPSSKIQKLMRRMLRRGGRNAYFNVLDVTLVAEQPTEFHIGDDVTTNNVRTFGRYSTMTSLSYCNQWIRRILVDNEIIPLKQLAR
jgi:hypothetical protein